jgi:thiamine pyrophosphate-dependent acetolactate synthase large subunit-like protein
MSETKAGTRSAQHAKDQSRRQFLRASAAGAGAAAFAAGVANQAFAEAVPVVDIPSIRIPKDIVDSVGAAPAPAKFEGTGMIGAQVFAKLCKEEGLAGLFCCPGNYTVINAIAAEGIPCYGGRTEGAMCAVADGFSRATGEVTACSGTEGPGFTNMIMNVAAANAARTPLLVLASNMSLAGDDREAFIQTAYQQPTTEGMKKYGKRLIDPKRVYEYGAHAFRNLKSGVPGPCHLDFPSEVARAEFKDASELTDYYDKSKYRTESRAHPAPKDVAAAIDLINKAERPMLIAGQGVFQRKAWDALKKAAEKNDLVVVETGPSRGHFGDDHRLSANTAENALMSADLVVFIGQYCMPSPGEFRFNPDVKTVRVHPVQEDLGRNWPLDLGIVSDEAFFLEALADGLPQRKRDTWTAEVAAARKAFDDANAELYKSGLKYSADTNHLHPAVIGQEIQNFFFTGKNGGPDPKQTVHASGGWTIGRFSARWLRGNHPGQAITAAYQYGAIGPDFAISLGAAAAQQRGVGPRKEYQGAPALCVTSDAGIAYSLFELDTASKYKLPVICVVYNNNSWGMWPAAARTPQAMHMYLFQENLRYDKLAEGLGARGEYCRTPDEFKLALARSYDAAAKDKASTLINCQALKEFTSAQAYPPGPPRNPEPGVGAFAH